MNIENEKSCQLAVIIPTLNEQHNLELLLPALSQVLQELDVRYEIVIVDGGSLDETCRVGMQQGARVIPQQENGYGGAILTGINETNAAYIITMDADLSHRPIFIKELWRRRDEAEVLIASRYVTGGKAEMPRHRQILSSILNTVFRRALSIEIQDLSSGFRMYRRETLANLHLIARDFDLLQEILVRVYAEGWRVVEIPFHYMPRETGKTHARLFKFGWAYTKTLFRMWGLRNSVESADYDFRAFSSWIWLQRYWQRSRHRIILAFLEQRASVLDIGCGSSRIILDLPEAIGLDVSQRKLRWLKDRHELLTRASCIGLPFKDESFGSVICSEVIEHVRDDPVILAEMGRVLKPGGILILGTPDYDKWLWWLLEGIYGRVLPGAYAQEHITHFTYQSLGNRLAEAGYEILDCKYVGYCEMIFKARKRSGLPSSNNRQVD